MKQLFTFFLSLQLILSPVLAAGEVSAEMTEAPVPKVNQTATYAKMVLGLTQGIIGTGIITQCSLGMTQPSLLLYMAGSLTYLGNEIFSAKDQGQTMDAQASELSEAGSDKQLEALKQQKKNEETNLKILKRKRNWMIAITTVYGLATAAAIIEFFLSKPTPAGINKPAYGNCANAKSTYKPVVKAIELAYLSSSLYQTVKGTVQAVQSKNAVSMGTAALSAGTSGVKQVKQFISIVEGSAEVTSKATNKLFNNPIPRAITFGASGVLTGIIASDLNKQKLQAEKNIADSEKVIAATQSATTPTIEVEQGAAAAAAKNKTYAIKELPKATAVKSCWASTNEGMDYSESSCANPIKLTNPKFDVSIKIPTLSNGSMQATEFAQAVADGDMAKADIAAGNLASMAGAVKDLNSQLETKYNDSQKAAGLETTDFKKEVAARVAALQKDVQDAAAAQGAQLASEKLDAEPAFQDLTPVVTSSAPATSAVEELKIDLTEDTGSEEISETVSAREQSLDQFEATEQDISKSDVSIFKQVSHRYILNYTKMMDKKPRLESPENSQ